MLKYIALGDSYTIGEGAQPNEAWPSLLENDLNKLNIPIKLVANPSVTGWTTQDLIDKELPVLREHGADFVTLLIGVNDWVQEVTIDTFSINFTYILEEIYKNLSNRNNLLVINIPDFGITPEGGQYSKGRDISKGLEEFNNKIQEICDARNIPVVDIFPSSKRMEAEAELVAEDGIHGSAKAYAIWEKLILPEAYKILSRK